MCNNFETRLTNPESPLERKIYELGPWFHNIHLPDGTQTAPNHPLGDFPKFKWEKISGHIPDDLEGYTVLDIGCNAGFYCIEMAKRGAKVVGIDIDDHYLRQARWAAKEFSLESKIEFRNQQVYDLISSGVVYDIVLFMGVFYHLRYPVLALDIVSGIFSQLMIFQTMTTPGTEIFETPDDLKIEEREIMLEPGWPKLAFIEKALAGDNTNWWAPNHAAVEALLRSSGLKIISYPDHEIYLCSKLDENDNISEFESALGAYKLKVRLET